MGGGARRTRPVGGGGGGFERAPLHRNTTHRGCSMCTCKVLALHAVTSSCPQGCPTRLSPRGAAGNLCLMQGFQHAGAGSPPTETSLGSKRWRCACIPCPNQRVGQGTRLQGARRQGSRGGGEGRHGGQGGPYGVGSLLGPERNQLSPAKKRVLSIGLIGDCGRFGVPLPFPHAPLFLEEEEHLQVWKALLDSSWVSEWNPALAIPSSLTPPKGPKDRKDLPGPSK